MVNSTEEALEYLAVPNNALSENQLMQLDKDGFCTVSLNNDEWLERGVDLDAISNSIDRITAKEGWRGGWEHISKNIAHGTDPEEGAQRLNNLLNKDECFQRLFTLPEVLKAAQHVIKNEMCLSSMILRAPKPGCGVQKLHIDWTPRKAEKDPYRGIIAALLLDDSTKESGATRYVPGSHKFLGAPSDYGYDTIDPHPDEVLFEAPRGTMLIYFSHLWHGGTLSVNGKPRRQIFLNYRDRKVWQSLNMKKFLDKEFISSLSDAEKYLLKVRPEDVMQPEWLFRRRNNWLIKRMASAIWSIRDKKVS